MEINEDSLNGNRLRLFIQNLLSQESQSPSFAFGRDSKAGRGVEKLYRGKKGMF